MSARGKLWLAAYIIGIALGFALFVLYRSQRPPNTALNRPNLQFPVGQLQEKQLEGTDLLEYSQSGYMLGTTINLKAQATDKPGVAVAFHKAFSRIYEIDLMMSTFRPDSPLSKINASGKARGYKVPWELGFVITMSLEFCRQTGGALDITVTPLLQAYKHAEAQKRAPTDKEISLALWCVGYEKVSVSGDFQTVTIADDGMALDLSATAKGYAADEAAKVLRENGIKNAFVEAGGDIRFVGPRGDGKPWRTGIQNPSGEQGDYLGVLELKEGAACTSGSYAQGYQLGRKRASHIIDPRTGEPCDQIRSVTVVAPKALTADALATALSVLGEEGLWILERWEGVEALVIAEESGRLAHYRSGGFDKLLKK